MTSLVIKLPRSTSESSELPARRKTTRRITSPADDDSSVTSAPPLKRARPDVSEDEASGSPETSRPSARASGLRAKAKQPSKMKKKIVLSDAESEEYDYADEESEVELPADDEDEYMSEPKTVGKRGGAKGKKGGAKGKKKAEPAKEIVARDERKRPADTGDIGEGSAAKRPRTRPGQQKSGDVLVDVVGDAPPAAVGTPPPPKEDSAPAPPKKKLPQIKKNKPAAGVAVSAGTATATSSTPAKAAPLSTNQEDSILPPPIVGAGAARKATIPLSADVDLSNPMLYAQLFNKSSGGSTPSVSQRHQKDEERRKELNRKRDDARAKRANEASPPFDLQGQMDKITRFEERLRNSRSPAVYPNFLAGALKAKIRAATPGEHVTIQAEPEKKAYARNDLEEGEM
ncbi:hypothetical protein C8F04DRAFT_1061745 [Mycena alexandri]|uniref:Uncharacterized protein n=1 Tax=Mycena alexandri TaxID=1745969 RepID=A0AAD6TK29_9AGAR|nr:hypothetical protein C8F04DRAFT_1061745 [Mycena alexandri]